MQYLGNSQVFGASLVTADSNSVKRSPLDPQSPYYIQLTSAAPSIGENEDSRNSSFDVKRSPSVRNVSSARTPLNNSSRNPN